MSKDEECNICVISDVSYPNPSSLIVFVGNLYDKSTMHFRECRLTLYFVIYVWVNIHLNSFPSQSSKNTLHNIYCFLYRYKTSFKQWSYTLVISYQYQSLSEK